jgi:hypothetical protein
MNPASLSKPSPLAVLLVYGRIAGVKLPQGGWFKASDAAAARESAKQLQLAVLDLKTDEERALTIGVQEGVAKSSGRTLIAAITEEMLARIEAYAKRVRPPERQALPAAATGATDAAIASPQEAGKASTSLSAQGSSWSELRVGSLVLAAYFDENEEIDGWWPALIRRVDEGKYIVTWRDAPSDPPVKTLQRHVAILHPDYLKSPD